MSFKEAHHFIWKMWCSGEAISTLTYRGQGHASAW